MNDHNKTIEQICHAEANLYFIFGQIISKITFYFYDGKKVFRLAIENHENGIGFLPRSYSERRIEYDPNYVTIIGKAVSMQVYFEDKIVVE